MSESNVPDVLVLPSGLRVITVHRPWSKMFGATLMYHAGTFDDPPGVPGTAHFAEHLAFAGANKQTFSEVAASGTQVNGVTGYDHTRYLAAGHVDDLDNSLVLFANILRNDRVTENDIAGERDVFLHELESDDDESARMRALDSFKRRILGDANWRKSQTKSSVKVKRFHADGLNSFKQQFYRPANARLAIVSPLSLEDLGGKIELHLPHEPGGEPYSERIRQRVPQNCSSRIRWDFNRYVWVFLMQTVPATTIAMRLTAEIFGHYLGGGPHSLLFQKLRREWGVAYDAHAGDQLHLSSTSVYCFSSFRCRSFDKSMRFVHDCLNKFAMEGITEDQLDEEKRRMIRRHELGVDHPLELASYLAYEALRSNKADSVTPDGYCCAVDSLSRCEVNNAAAELFAQKNRSVFIGGQIDPLSLLRLLTRRAP
jgi:predicted Zn-dependent peptidase